LDDGNFWVGGIAHPNPCNLCTIKIYADVKMVQNGFSSVPAYNCAFCTFLNDVVITNSTITLYGNTTLAINTYLQLFDTKIVLGNDPTATQVIKLNDQVDLNGTATVHLASIHTSVDANDTSSLAISPIVGPHDDFFNIGFKSPGLFGIIPPDINGYDFTWILNQSGIGTSENHIRQRRAYFTIFINCSQCTRWNNWRRICFDLIVQPLIRFRSHFRSICCCLSFWCTIETKNDDGSVKTGLGNFQR
jgi:hypothetical protein